MGLCHFKILSYEKITSISHRSKILNLLIESIRQTSMSWIYIDWFLEYTNCENSFIVVVLLTVISYLCDKLQF